MHSLQREISVLASFPLDGSVKVSPRWSNSHLRLFFEDERAWLPGRYETLSLKEALVLINSREYGRAISILQDGASNESKSPTERIQLCEWLAECHRKLEDYKTSGDWYLEAIKRVFSQQQLGMKSKAKQALPLSEKALESYKEGGDTVDVLEAAKLKQRLLELAK